MYQGLHASKNWRINRRVLFFNWISSAVDVTEINLWDLLTCLMAYHTKHAGISWNPQLVAAWFPVFWLAFMESFVMQFFGPVLSLTHRHRFGRFQTANWLQLWSSRFTHWVICVGKGLCPAGLRFYCRHSLDQRSNTSSGLSKPTFVTLQFPVQRCLKKH